VIPLPDALYSPPIAHRGLWGDDAPENSLTAIERAIQAGYGVEFDVRLSSDGEAMVFHDDTLERMTGRSGSIEALPASALAAIPLLGSEDRIPTLAQALEAAGNDAMLLVEIKAGANGAQALARRAAQLLYEHPGPKAAISFDAAALAFLAAHQPQLPRGLDAMWPDGDEQAAERFERDCALAEPHFLVLQLRTALQPAAARQRAQGRPVIAWTVRSPDDLAVAADHIDNFIFEGFTG
jgi:glycerophosphoryl diester phosphodiesterase